MKFFELLNCFWQNLTKQITSQEGWQQEESLRRLQAVRREDAQEASGEHGEINSLKYCQILKQF